MRQWSCCWQGHAVAYLSSLALTPGNIVVLAGANGSGKSTVLKTLARQIKAIAGQILLSGQAIWSLKACQFAKQVAYVPQILETTHALTVEELITLGRNPHQPWWSWNVSACDKAAIDEAIEATNIGHLRHKNIFNLSGGERQRTAIAIALAQKAQFMLLDEPTVHLDFRYQLELAGLLKSLKYQDIGMLMVLHDLNLMARLADEIVFLEKQEQNLSKVFATGKARDVLSAENLRRVYNVEVTVLTNPANGSRSFVPGGAWEGGS